MFYFLFLCFLPSKLTSTQTVGNKRGRCLFHFNFLSNIVVAVQFGTTAVFYLAAQPSSLLLDHLFRVLVHCFHEGAHVLRLHVGVEAVAQVGDVAPWAETLQHLLHDLRDLLLGRE